MSHDRLQKLILLGANTFMFVLEVHMVIPELLFECRSLCFSSLVITARRMVDSVFPVWLIQSRIRAGDQFGDVNNKSINEKLW